MEQHVIITRKTVELSVPDIAGCPNPQHDKAQGQANLQMTKDQMSLYFFFFRKVRLRRFFRLLEPPITHRLRAFPTNKENHTHGVSESSTNMSTRTISIYR
ncbi:hypothetical protein GA0061078_1448 [Bifidobacterium bohemicum]|uniref:Uncharacterized protein n=1 Tax=Bifidobacterium bohemicum DSM 22767 TaxID=1437606 RepID=A0A086ZH27_9BIFI|nr:hypothetical protein BBOH_0630 [Bifidobacterium bohemicum DSM 22767]SCC09956.1 hypothetical protein GA0061078_1448 [Bifidobacterium bohemicum]